MAPTPAASGVISRRARPGAPPHFSGLVHGRSPARRRSFGAAKSGRGLVGKEEAITAQIEIHKKLLAWCIERFENDD
jgi:hypothetical protein